ncbi:MAG: DUF4417 domain-containing protein [Anaerolineae bacterium]|nr:DUF4417 domain-containing protein [Anaerolineae bacterium]
MQSSAAKWQSRPGNYDALNTEYLYPSDNVYGIPDLAHVSQSACPDWLVPYGQRLRSDRGFTDGAVHFFLDDYRFETVWSRPRKALQYLRHFNTLLTADFSLYRDVPLALQIWNTYRSRWCGAFWQAQGFTVIPTVSWSSLESYAFCFAGLPQHSLLAISTVGTHKDPSDRAFFLNGFEQMVECLSPSCVLCYGQVHPEMKQLVELKIYPSRWAGLHIARADVRRQKGGSHGR